MVVVGVLHHNANQMVKEVSGGIGRKGGEGEEGGTTDEVETAEERSMVTLGHSLGICTSPKAFPDGSSLTLGRTHGQCGVEDVVQVDREEVEEAFTACRGYCVARVVHVGPGIGPLGQTAIGQKVQNTLHGPTQTDRKQMHTDLSLQ